MSQQPSDFETRLSAVEERLEIVAADAVAARHLAAANDRDYAGLALKVDANRSAINALGLQTAARFDRLERKVDEGFADMRAKFGQVDEGFVEMRGKFDQLAGGMQHIVELLDTRRDKM